MYDTQKRMANMVICAALIFSGNLFGMPGSIGWWREQDLYADLKAKSQHLSTIDVDFERQGFKMEGISDQVINPKGSRCVVTLVKGDARKNIQYTYTGEPRDSQINKAGNLKVMSKRLVDTKESATVQKCVADKRSKDEMYQELSRFNRNGRHIVFLEADGFRMANVSETRRMNGGACERTYKVTFACNSGSHKGQTATITYLCIGDPGKLICMDFTYSGPDLDGPQPR